MRCTFLMAWGRPTTCLYLYSSSGQTPTLTAFFLFIDYLGDTERTENEQNYLADHSKYKNNYDYQLAALIIGGKFYMTNDSIVLTENKSVFSPISQLNYEFYSNPGLLKIDLEKNADLQCIVGKNFIPFGEAQCPAVNDYADSVDTLIFLNTLH